MESIKKLANSTGRTKGTGNRKKTKEVIYIAIGIMFVWLIPLIFISITYYCFLHVYFFILYKRQEKNQQRYKKQYRALILNIINQAHYYCLFRKSSTKFRKVSVIFCKYYYFYWIHITDLACYLLLGFNALIVYRTEISNKIV